MEKREIDDKLEKLNEVSIESLTMDVVIGSIIGFVIILIIHLIMM